LLPCQSYQDLLTRRRPARLRFSVAVAVAVLVPMPVVVPVVGVVVLVRMVMVVLMPMAVVVPLRDGWRRPERRRQPASAAPVFQPVNSPLPAIVGGGSALNRHGRNTPVHDGERSVMTGRATMDQGQCATGRARG